MGVAGRIEAGRVKRVAVGLVALCGLAVALVGCQSAPIPGVVNGGGSSTIQIVTPNPGQLSPTPTFPPFTIGAWPSNYSPNNQDTITIYVICRVQPADMQGPSKVASGLQVSVDVGPPVNNHFSGTTDNDGMAAIQVPINDPKSGTPVTVTVNANYNNQTFTATTFFTPSPMANGTPTPTVTATPGQ
jgi:hypothetical protein